MKSWAPNTYRFTGLQTPPILVLPHRTSLLGQRLVWAFITWKSKRYVIIKPPSIAPDQENKGHTQVSWSSFHQFLSLSPIEWLFPRTIHSDSLPSLTLCTLCTAGLTHAGLEVACGTGERLRQAVRGTVVPGSTGGTGSAAIVGIVPCGTQHRVGTGTGTLVTPRAGDAGCVSTQRVVTTAAGSTYGEKEVHIF